MMTTWQRMGRVNNWLPITIVCGLILFGALVPTFFQMLFDPLDVATAEISGQLAWNRSICENRVRALAQKGIDGHKEYEKAEAAVNRCIGYLDGVLAQGGGDPAKVKTNLDAASTALNTFVQWADKQLDEKTTADIRIDLVDRMMRLLNDQEMKRRKMVQDVLNQYQFRNWDAIVKELGQKQ
jgi:hypothetical protein